MVKHHNCLVKITNNSGTDMIFCRDWFKMGRLANGFNWPHEIKNGSHSVILCYEKDWSFIGCSGYVTYKMGSDEVTEVTIAFSNPLFGHSKLEVGTGGITVWDKMSYHHYREFDVHLTISGVSLVFHCKCTATSTNTCTVEVERAWKLSSGCINAAETDNLTFCDFMNNIFG